MALGGAALRAPSMLEQLLEEINFQRTKDMRQLLKDESGFVVLQGTTYWTDLFVRHFLFQEEQAIDCDDLLFFVRKRHVRGSSRYLPKYETEVEVFRKDSKKLPIGDPEVDWEETVYLNLVVHQFDYTLTLAVCTRTSPKELQVLRRHSQKVYASPSRRKMDTKGEGEEITYPHICFMVDNFDEVFSDMVVRDGEMVCVELVARGRGASALAVLFLGSIRYDALSRVYDSRQTSLSTKVAQRMSFGLLGRAAARCEFVRMKGPSGKGHAEMAVARPRGGGADTPCSEPGLPADWDEDWDEDPDDLFMCRHQRRLSDPSANLNNFSRSGWRARDTRDHTRSEDGLDLPPGLAEVEAGDLRDAGRASSLCAPRAPRAPPAPPALRPLPRAAAAARPAARPAADPRCELATDAAAHVDAGLLPTDETDTRAGGVVADADARETVRGVEELPLCGEHWLRADRAGAGDSAGARAYATLPRNRRGLAGALYARAPLPPRRTTPDGTDVYYWCDAKRRELDDGAYNPLWAMRGFTQTFALWKEGKRAQSAPLSAYLTYVTLPWWSIAKDILDHREEPILTF